MHQTLASTGARPRVAQASALVGTLHASALPPMGARHMAAPTLTFARLGRTSPHEPASTRASASPRARAASRAGRVGRHHMAPPLAPLRSTPSRSSSRASALAAPGTFASGSVQCLEMRATLEFVFHRDPCIVSKFVSLPDVCRSLGMRATSKCMLTSKYVHASNSVPLHRDPHLKAT